MEVVSKMDYNLPHCYVGNLSNHKKEHISIVGQLISQHSSWATFLGSDGKIFLVISKENEIKFNNKYIQIKGYVNENQTVKYKSHISIGDEFDMWTWYKFCQLTETHPQLFL